MKSKFVRTGLLIIVASILGVIVATPARACSMVDAAGKWAFTDSGTVIGVGPRVAVGVLVLDANGSVRNGKATSSLNGSIAEETFYGTFTVNSRDRQVMPGNECRHDRVIAGLDDPFVFVCRAD